MRSAGRKEVSFFYWSIEEVIDGDFKLAAELWGASIPDEHWEDLWQTPFNKLFTFVKPAWFRRNHYFTTHRAYLSPSRLSKIAKGPHVSCKKCDLVNTSDIHMFKDCPGVAEYWERVGATLADILGTPVQISLALIIFGIASGVTGPVRRFLFYTILQARREICRRWVEATPPTHSEWLSSLYKTSKTDLCRLQNSKKKALWDCLLNWSQV